jgi:hypothetical protein
MRERTIVPRDKGCCNSPAMLRYFLFGFGRSEETGELLINLTLQLITNSEQN